MSIISNASADLAKTVTEAVQEFEDILEKAEADLEMDGLSLEQLCKRHPKSVREYYIQLHRCKSLEDFINMRLDEAISIAWKQLNENHSRSLTTKDIQIYVNQDQSVLTHRELLMEISYLRKQFEAICSALDSAGYSINNIVKIRVAEMHRDII